MESIDFRNCSAESLALLAKHGNQPNICEDAKAEIARRALEAELLAFARAYCSRSLETLEERGSDALDFFSCGVAGLREALHGAYQAGLNAARLSPEARNQAQLLKHYRGEYGILVDAVQAAIDAKSFEGLGELVFDDDLHRPATTPEERSREAWRTWRRTAGADAIRFEDAALAGPMPKHIAEVARLRERPAHFWEWLRNLYLCETGQLEDDECPCPMIGCDASKGGR